LERKLNPFEVNLRTRLESGELQLPQNPVLKVWELPGTPADRDARYRGQLPAEVSRYLQPHQRVVDIQYPSVEFPPAPLEALDICMKAAHAPTPDQIGRHGPTVASVNPLEDSGERSRYEAQHGRDDLQAAEDLEDDFPALGDATIRTLAESQGVEDEPNIPGMPFRQEKEGSIILLNLPEDDPLARKFSLVGGWGYPRYTSADAPGAFINFLARKYDKDNSYPLRHNYDARDGQSYPYTKAFERSVQWLLDRTAENPEGLVEYKMYPYGGMRHQGWRDSASALLHKDGTWADSENGLAAIDVQAISYDALMNAARIFRDLYRDDKTASLLEERAWNLQKFVIDNGMAGGHLVSGWDHHDDGRFRQIGTMTSAVGRVLKTGLLKGDSPQLQELVRDNIRALMSPDMLTRWGVRTMSQAEVGYVPFSYHVGPIWLHDSNENAAAMSSHGFYGLDRMVGATTANQHDATGLFYEHISGYDTAEPHVPSRDTYVYDELHDELFLFEQVPPMAQTWAATTEYAKQRRYQRIPPHAIDIAKLQFERSVWKTLPDHIQAVVGKYQPETAAALSR